MKFFISILFCIVCFDFSLAQHDHATSTTDTAKTAAKSKSPRRSAMAMIGENHVHIDYGSPSVRGRQIWNGLVAYDQVWATGAHKATWIDFGHDVIINNIVVPKGKYGFFTIPGKSHWTLIFNKVWDMHLADDYDPKQDIVRLNAKPSKNKELVETLTYEVMEGKKGKGKIRMNWEYLSIEVDFENK